MHIYIYLYIYTYTNAHTNSKTIGHQLYSMFDKSYSVLVNNNYTDISINNYNNRIFLIISQYRKLGSLVSVYKESIIHEYNSNVYDTKVIFGKDDPEIHAASRYIAEQMNIDKPLLISICLKDFEISTLHTIIKSIKKMKL